MSKYLFIESRDPFESNDSGPFAELIEGVTARGNQSVLFLVQNGVLAARQGSKYGGRITGLLKAKVKVLADRFSVKERSVSRLVEGVESIDMNQFVDLLLDPGTKVVWH